MIYYFAKLFSKQLHGLLFGFSKKTQGVIYGFERFFYFMQGEIRFLF